MGRSMVKDSSHNATKNEASRHSQNLSISKCRLWLGSNRKELSRVNMRSEIGWNFHEQHQAQCLQTQQKATEKSTKQSAA